MKFLVFIISIFLLGQSLSYCQDESAGQDVVIEHCGDHDDSNKNGDPCSSICACSCCLIVSFSTTETTISNPIIEFFLLERSDAIEIDLPSQFISGLLQPPQFA
ncbi:hypothetical protein BST97_10180 [Nonlabens spongiae]|uniref:Uncharacterized protein n=1 Tax=Nonlabens spongiae TaxID=331648 RepID=A0A1W6MLD5_9FLAO|nr:hypothetical protein BST97_10180 [Nonlabens spongiae]